MPVYNMAKYLADSIDSVLSQTYNNIELIVLDDGSKDNSRGIAQECIEKAKDLTHVDIKHICQENKGLACARNSAIKHSTGDYIALLDPDDIWFPERLHEGVTVLENNPDISFVHANITYIDEDSQILRIPKRNISYLSGEIFNYLLTRKAHLSCPTVLFKKSILDDIGNFDEYLTYLGCEDRDLWLRISKRYKIQYIDKCLAYYRKVGGSMSSNTEKMLKARQYVVKKHTQDECSFVLKRQGYAAIYLELADHYYVKGKFFEAIRQYMKSICYWPFDYSSWINLSKSFVKRSLTTNNNTLN